MLVGGGRRSEMMLAYELLRGLRLCGPHVTRATEEDGRSAHVELTPAASLAAQRGSCEGHGDGAAVGKGAPASEGALTGAADGVMPSAVRQRGLPDGIMDDTA